MTTPTTRDPIDPAVFISRCRTAQRRGALATVIASGVADIPVGARLAVHPGGYIESDVADAGLAARIAGDARGVVTSARSTSRHYRGKGGAIEVQIDAVIPPARLFVFGAGELVDRVVAAAVMRGWDVHASGPGLPRVEDATTIDHSDRAAAIVIAHGDALDRQLLETLLATRIRYIGVAGARHRIDAVLAYVNSTFADDRVHAPIVAGADCESPRTVADALIAEAHAAVSGNTPIRPTLRRLARLEPIAAAS